MQLGTVGPFLLATAVVAWATWRSGLRPTIAMLVALALATVLDDVWKEVIERPRPAGLVEGLHVRVEATGFAFPSGHTTMACALAAVLHPLLPARWRPVAWALAIAAGFGRLYVGVHWPMDLVGGLTLGVAIAAAAWTVTGQGYRRA